MESSAWRDASDLLLSTERLKSGRARTLGGLLSPYTDTPKSSVFFPQLDATASVNSSDSSVSPSLVTPTSLLDRTSDAPDGFPFESSASRIPQELRKAPLDAIMGNNSYYADFMGAQEDVDSDLDTLRRLKDTFSTSTTSPTPVSRTTPNISLHSCSSALSASLPMSSTPVDFTDDCVIGYSGQPRSDLEDDQAGCPRSKDIQKVVVRGWSPSGDDRFPHASVSLDAWVPMRSAMPFASQVDNAQPFSQPVITSLPSLEGATTPNISAQPVDLDATPRPRFQKASTGNIWARRAPTTWHTSSTEKVAKRRRGAHGEFVNDLKLGSAADRTNCSPPAVKVKHPESAADVHRASTPIHRVDGSLPRVASNVATPQSKSKAPSPQPLRRSPRRRPSRAAPAPTIAAVPAPFTFRRGPCSIPSTSPANGSSGQQQATRPVRPLLYALLPPHLARSITKQALAVRAAESERMRHAQDAEMQARAIEEGTANDERVPDEGGEVVVSDEVSMKTRTNGEHSCGGFPCFEGFKPHRTQFCAAPEGQVQCKEPIVTTPRRETNEPCLQANRIPPTTTSVPVPYHPSAPYHPPLRRTASLPVSVSAAIPFPRRGTKGSAWDVTDSERHMLLRSVASSLALSFRRTMSESSGAFGASSLAPNSLLARPDENQAAQAIPATTPLSLVEAPSLILGIKRSLQDDENEHLVKRVRLES